MSMAYYPNAPLPNTNARQESMTIRPSSTALLTIDSEDRYKNYTEARAKPTSPYNFTISKNESLMNGFFTRLAVTEVNFPWTIPNINDKTNKIIVNWVTPSTPMPGGTAVIELPNDFYKPLRLASYLETTIQSLSPDLSGFQMTYGAPAFVSNLPSNSPLFYYTTGNNVVPEDYVISFEPLPYNSSQYPYPPQTKQLFDLLGFNDQNMAENFSSSGTFTYCQAIRYIDIVCNQLTSVASVKDQTSQTISRDMLCRVYLGDGGGTGQSTTPADASDFSPTGCAPTTIYRAFPHPKQIAWIPNQPISGFLQFQVYDDAGDLLSNSVVKSQGINGEALFESTNWSMTLLVSEN